MEIFIQFTVEQWHLTVLFWIFYFLAGVVAGRIVYKRIPTADDDGDKILSLLCGALWPILLLGVVVFRVGWFLVSLITFKNGKK